MSNILYGYNLETRKKFEVSTEEICRAINCDEGFSDNYFDLPPGRDRVVTFHPEIPVQDISEHIQIQSLIDAVQP